MSPNPSRARRTKEGSAINLTIAFSISTRVAIAGLSFATGVFGCVARHLHWLG
jgi:hypothetical protein